VTRPVHSPGGPGSRHTSRRGAGRDLPALSDDAFEASRLLLELVHVAYATRAAEAETAAAARAPRGTGVSAAGRVLRSAPSTHAIRAAIHVYQHGERTIGELAEGLGISYGWASRVVSELEATGMVERRVDPVDRRVVHVSLTSDAAEMVERTYRWRGEAVDQALAGLDAHDREVVRTFLRRVTEELARAGQERHD
jgi:DNA-binding MarR family transcriptional regulator